MGELQRTIGWLDLKFYFWWWRQYYWNEPNFLKHKKKPFKSCSGYHVPVSRAVVTWTWSYKISFNLNLIFAGIHSLKWGYISCRWQYWSWMMASCIFHFSKVVSIKENKKFFNWDECCHLVMCLHLMERNGFKIVTWLEAAKQNA